MVLFKKGKKQNKTTNKKKVKTKPSKFKELHLKFKRWQEMEKEKKELKKQDINYSIKPKGYFARKFGVITFWTLFSFMFLVVAITLFSGNDEATADENLQVKVNPSSTPEAIQFAENFLADYFTWQVSEVGRQERTQTMLKYMSEDLRGHAALDIKNMEWNSVFKGADLKRITEKGENLAYITFLVDFEFTKIGAGNDSEGNPEVQRLKKYIDVPVAFDGHSYGVYELPKFTYIYEDETTVKQVKTTERLEQADVTISEKIKEFLPTFFKTYAEDEKDKLNYMIKNENVTDGLNGTMNFDKINSLQAFKGNAENEFIVFTEVIFIEPETQASFIVNHQLELTLEEDRLLVSGMNNQKNKGVISNIENKGNDEIEEDLTNDDTNDNPKDTSDEQSEQEEQ